MLLRPAREPHRLIRRHTAWRAGVAAAETAFLSFLVSALPVSSGDVTDVRVAPAEAVQGDTVAVIVHAAPGTVVVVRLDGAPVPTFAAGGALRRALIATDPDTRTGRYTIAVTITRPGEPPVRIVRIAHVRAGAFRARRLTLPPKTFGLITPKNLAIERDALRPVLLRQTPVAWWQGPFQAPSTGEMDSPYGEQGIYNGHREWWHQGVDFSAPAGSPVTAGNAGVVTLARTLPLGGNTIVIDHGQGVVTEYLHLSAFTVAVGDRVEKGTVIGRIGATGLVTGPSLHWGLYVLGVPVNPLFWLAPHAGLTS